MEIRLPIKVRIILNKLEEAGFEAYAVGGCVRDSVLSRIPEDWDITTSASPMQVKELFKHTVDTGLAHGTVTVLIEGDGFEVTTYRIDGEYEDGRHPKEVTFTSNLLEDLKRRDFTINAMAYNEKKGLIDIFGGVEDLEGKKIRCVGDPKERFKEDALRMMRAIRFSAQLGFTINDKTKEAIKEMSRTLDKISEERIQAELVKLLISNHPEEIRTMYETGLSRIFLPEFDEMMNTKQLNPHHAYTVGEHTIRALVNIPADKVLRFTMLFHDIAKPLCLKIDENGIYHFKGHQEAGAKMTKKIMRRLKFDNDTIDKVTRLVLVHDEKPKVTPFHIRQEIYQIGEPQFPALFQVKRADILAQSQYLRKEKLEYIDAYEKQYWDIIKRGDCVSLKELAVKGDDLIKIGMKPGKEIGEMLSWLLLQVIIEPENNKKEILMKKIAERE